MQFHFWLNMYMLTDGHGRHRVDYEDNKGYINILQRPYHGIHGISAMK